MATILEHMLEGTPFLPPKRDNPIVLSEEAKRWIRKTKTIVDDRLPIRPTLKKSYEAIYVWYKANKFFLNNQDLLSRDTNFKDKFFALVENLPSPAGISDIEIRAILKEVLLGHLEPCYYASDGHYKMAAYAKAGLTSVGDSATAEFSDEERSILTQSTLWTYLHYLDI